MKIVAAGLQTEIGDDSNGSFIKNVIEPINKIISEMKISSFFIPMDEIIK